MAALAVGNFLNGLVYVPYQLQLAHGWTGLTLRINVFAVALLVPTILWVCAASRRTRRSLGVDRPERRLHRVERWIDAPQAVDGREVALVRRRRAPSESRRGGCHVAGLRVQAPDAASRGVWLAYLCGAYLAALGVSAPMIRDYRMRLLGLFLSRRRAVSP